MITREHQFEAAPLFSYNIFSRKRNSAFGNDLNWAHNTLIKDEVYQAPELSIHHNVGLKVLLIRFTWLENNGLIKVKSYH